MLDIESLRVIWWALLGILFIGFAIMDGFDLGAATLLPLVAHNETERRIVLNTVGPVWEGNQVWIILGAGAIFAAWPYVYSVAFSGFYLLILLLLLTMGISRPVSFKYRSKLPNHFWRRFWDWVVFIGGAFPALIFGILVGNVLTGAPFYFDNSLRVSYAGSFLDLFGPFPLWCGLTSLTMLTMHGGLYLAIKTKSPIRDRAIFWSRLTSMLLIVFFALGGVWVAYGLVGYEVVSGANPFGFSNPLHKEVIPKVGAWVQNYRLYPLSMLAPALGFIGALGVLLTARLGNSGFAFVCSSLSLAGIITTVGVSLFPFLLPSSINLSSSLLVWDASSSELTLLVMFFSAIIFVPIILLYTAWVYRAMRGKVDKEMIEQDEHHTAY
jgi:cytochrome bd ubiquinol oxidase subunit II